MDAMMTHDRYLTAALSGMIMCMVCLLGVILVRVIAPPEKSRPMTAGTTVTADTTVAVLRGSLW